MLNKIFHNDKSSLNNLKIKEFPKVYYLKKQVNVDVNKLLNRVKIDQKNETKRKIIFYSLSILALSLFSTLIMIVK